MTYKDTASFGKRQEYRIVAELLLRGFDVYMTLVDDKGIDCVVRLDEHRYLDIQIKARSEQAKQGFLFAGMRIQPRPNLYFIFYTESNNTYWVMPSSEVVQLGVKNKTGKNVGKISLAFPRSNTSGKNSRFEPYKNAFDLLHKYDHLQ